MSIKERFEELQEAVRQHAPGRAVTIVAVSKYASVEQMVEAFEAGVRDFGENRVQDALGKMIALPAAIGRDVRWHFIGNLQSNKAAKTVGRFDLIHAIDSVSQAEALSKANLAAGRQQPVLIQINVSTDPGKHGFLPDQAPAAVRDLLGLEGIALRGLMTMAPAEVSTGGHVQELMSFFSGLRGLRDELEAEFAIQLPDLSMGMSHDFTQALECGATIIRIGNYLFKNDLLTYNKA